MRQRLILSYIFIVLVSVTSVALIASRQTVEAVNSFVHRGGLSGNEGVVRNLERFYTSRGTWEGIGEYFERAAPGKGSNQRLQLADADGLVLVDTHRVPVDSGLNRKLDAPERSRAIDLTVDGQVVGYLLPEINPQIPQIATLSLVSQINKAAFTAAIIVSVIALALALYLSYRLLRPVTELTRAARQLAAGDLNQRVPVRGDDELATLATTFNQMAASLQQAETRRKAMTADIAHELRTPLAVQRAHLEALEDGIYDLTLEGLKPIEEHNRLLTRMVDDLRTLALADSGQLTLIRTDTNIADLVGQVISRFEPKTVENHIHIQFVQKDRFPLILVDAQRIEQILHNLLDNALRFTPDGGQIDVEMTAIPGQCVLTIRDYGPGIPTEDLPLIFERFYRADKARSRVDGGTGLGLSIAKNIAQAHNGDLIVENHTGGGALFTLLLPVLDS